MSRVSLVCWCFLNLIASVGIFNSCLGQIIDIAFVMEIKIYITVGNLPFHAAWSLLTSAQLKHRRHAQNILATTISNVISPKNSFVCWFNISRTFVPERSKWKQVRHWLGAEHAGTEPLPQPIYLLSSIAQICVQHFHLFLALPVKDPFA